MRRHFTQKVHQHARTLGKLEAVNQLIRYRGAGAANHIAHVLFGQLVVRQIQCVKAFFAEFLSDFDRFLRIIDRNADHDVRRLGLVHAVVEFGHAALLPNQLAQTQKRAALFGNSHRKQRLA